MKRKPSLYSKIAQDLISQISFGKFKTVDFPSESDLCKIYSVSRKTVRRALKILEKRGLIEAEQGKNRKVTSDEDNSNGSILNVACFVSHAYIPYTDLCNELRKKFAAHGVKIHFSFQGRDRTCDIDFLSQEDFSALIFAGIKQDMIIKNAMERLAGKPAVAINYNECMLKLDVIGTDMFMNTYRAVQHLVDNGHRRIGGIFLPGNESNSDGLKKCMEANNLQYEDKWILGKKDFDIDSSTLDALIKDNSLTALFIAVYRAHGANLFKYFAKNNIKVPEDISVIGCNHVELEIGSKIVKPDCMATDWAGMAEAAVERIMKLSKAGKYNHIKHFVESEMINYGTVRKIEQT